MASEVVKFPCPHCGREMHSASYAVCSVCHDRLRAEQEGQIIEAVRGWEQDLPAAVARYEALGALPNVTGSHREVAGAAFFEAMRSHEKWGRRAEKASFDLRPGQREVGRFSRGVGKRAFVLIGPAALADWDGKGIYEAKNVRLAATPRRGGDREFGQAVILAPGDQTLYVWFARDRVADALASFATGDFSERLVVAAQSPMRSGPKVAPLRMQGAS